MSNSQRTLSYPQEQTVSTKRAPFAVNFGISLVVSAAVLGAGAVAPWTLTPSPNQFFDAGQYANGSESVPGTAYASATGGSEARTVSHMRAITELTTGQVARLFGVSRRTVHNWLSGAAMADSHVVRLAQLQRQIDGLYAQEGHSLREILLDSSKGKSLFQQMVEQQASNKSLHVEAVSPREVLSS